MEVMGLMLGEFVDDYTVRVVDVRAPSYLILSFWGGRVREVLRLIRKRSLLCLKAGQECRSRLWIPFSRQK